MWKFQIGIPLLAMANPHLQSALLQRRLHEYANVYAYVNLLDNKGLRGARNRYNSHLSRHFIFFWSR